MSYAFRFSNYFTGLIQSDYDTAFADVSTQFAGVSTLWSNLESTLRQSKIDLTYQYLTAWYLADMNPSKVTGIQALGGMPLSSKSIDGVSVTLTPFEIQEGLKQLASNVFGIKALQMMQSAPERWKFYG